MTGGEIIAALMGGSALILSIWKALGIESRMKEIKKSVSDLWDRHDKDNEAKIELAATLARIEEQLKGLGKSIDSLKAKV